VEINNLKMPRHLIDIQKAQIATKIDSRFPSNVVAEEFNVTQRTVQRIKKMARKGSNTSILGIWSSENLHCCTRCIIM
jgi:hypothetical protein